MKTELRRGLTDAGYCWLVKRECLNKLNNCLKNGNNI